jgi:hypothetical protein
LDDAFMLENNRNVMDKLERISLSIAQEKEQVILEQSLAINK